MLACMYVRMYVCRKAGTLEGLSVRTGFSLLALSQGALGPTCTNHNLPIRKLPVRAAQWCVKINLFLCMLIYGFFYVCKLLFV